MDSIGREVAVSISSLIRLFKIKKSPLGCFGKIERFAFIVDIKGIRVGAELEVSIVEVVDFGRFLDDGMKSFVVYDIGKIEDLGVFIMHSCLDFLAGAGVGIIEVIFGKREVFCNFDNELVHTGKRNRVDTKVKHRCNHMGMLLSFSAKKSEGGTIPAKEVSPRCLSP